MPAQLVPLEPGPIASVLLTRPVLLVGRHPECDVRIDSPQVSRRHCCLALAYDRLLIRDLGSRNGVRVNGRLVEEVQLRPGDEVAIAQFLFRLQVDPDDAKPAPRNNRPASPPANGAAPPPAVDLDDDLIALDE